MNSYIICSPNLKDAYNKALSMAADLTGKKDKVLSGVHPDVITLYKEKSEFTVEQVRRIVNDASILPNESDYKVYIIYDGKDMNIQAQNAALKLLEEPPAGVVLILLSTSASTFLPTIRSRCAEISINSQSSSDAEANAFAEGFVRAYASADRLTLYTFCEANSKMTISECRANMEQVRRYITDMLCFRKDSMGMSVQTLLEFEALIEKCLKYLTANVNVKQIFGMIEVSI